MQPTSHFRILCFLLTFLSYYCGEKKGCKIFKMLEIDLQLRFHRSHQFSEKHLSFFCGELHLAWTPKPVFF